MSFYPTNIDLTNHFTIARSAADIVINAPEEQKSRDIDLLLKYLKNSLKEPIVLIVTGIGNDSLVVLQSREHWSNQIIFKCLLDSDNLTYLKHARPYSDENEVRNDLKKGRYTNLFFYFIIPYQEKEKEPKESKNELSKYVTLFEEINPSLDFSQLTTESKTQIKNSLFLYAINDAFCLLLAHKRIWALWLMLKTKQITHLKAR